VAIFSLLKGIVAPLLGPLLDKIPDVNEKRRLEAMVEDNILKAITGVVMAQIEVNKIEAKHTSIFVAGWRPAVGWTCGLALFWHFIVQPLLMWIAFLFDVDLKGAPSLEIGELMTVLLGMLGLGGLRTYEKQAGVARSSLGKGNAEKSS
jgi:hypothetical protein